MGPWESVIVAVSVVAGVFFAVMGFRGLVETVTRCSGECQDCGRTTLLPLPQSLRCRHCHYGALRVADVFAWRSQLRH